MDAWLAKYTFGYSSYNHYVQVIKTMFEMAVNDKALVASPAERMKGKKVVKPIRVTPTFEEFNAIIADMRQQNWNAEAQVSADFLEFMGLVGVGQAEITGPQRQHVNVAKQEITFFRQKTRTPYTVPIYPQAEPLVKKLLAKPGMKPTDPLFSINLIKSKNVEAEGKTKDAKKSLQAACKRLGYPAYTQRSLRRMFITRCIEKGIDVR